MPRLRSTFQLALIVAVLLTGTVASAQTTEQKRTATGAEDFDISAAWGKLPLVFEANQGQADPSVDFLSRGAGYTLLLGPTEAVLALRGEVETRLRMTLAGSNVTHLVSGVEPLPGVMNSFIGRDPERWRTGIPTYARVEYRDVYPGIDLVYYGNHRQMEYDFIVAPGADPGVIALAFDGSGDPIVDASGDLILCLSRGEVRLRRPVAYQVAAGKRKPVGASYRITPRGVTFEVAAFDRTIPLVIDPVIVYSTYLNSPLIDRPNDIAVDASGNTVVAGVLYSQDSTGSISDAFVAKLSADGAHLLYFTVLGGTAGRYEEAASIALDASGNAYVTGWTESADFPITAGAFDTTHEGNSDAFVTKLSANGSILYSTFLGGTSSESGLGIGVDADGNAWVSGVASTDFPTTPGAFQTSPGGLSDAFATRLNASGSALLYSTYLGGTNYEDGRVAVDAAGNAWVAGTTASTNFPVTDGAFQTTSTGLEEGFVAKFNADGSGLAWATFVGGSASENLTDIAIDASGNAYIVGTTASSDFPTTPGAYATTLSGPADAYITKLDAGGANQLFSTYLGGSHWEMFSSVAIDSGLNVWVFGQTYSADFPVTRDTGSGPDADFPDTFVAKLDPTGTSLLDSSFLGGSRGEYPGAIAIDAAGDAYVTGYTFSTDFPVTPAVLQTSGAAVLEDGFVTKLTTTPESDTTPPGLIEMSFFPQTVDTTFEAQTVTITMKISDDLAGVRSACAYFRTPSGALRFSCATRSSGTNFSGWWSADLTIPQFAESGIWRLVEVELSDRAGNFAEVSESVLAGRGFPTELTVISVSDTAPPEITRITVSPTSVDVSAGPATITVELAATDDITGVLLGSPCGLLYAALQMVGPSSRQPRDMGCWNFARIGGTDRDGVWRGTFTMPRYSEAGTWELGTLRILDGARNARVLTHADAVALGMVPLEVISVPSDTTPPRIVGLEFEPVVINTSSGPATVTVRVTAEDDLSGVDLRPILSFQSGYVVFRSPSGGQSVSGFFAQLVEGTALHGVWQASMTFPRFSESGTWQITRLELKDAVSNRLALLTADLQNLVLPDLIVIRPSLDPDGVLTPAGGTVFDTAFGARASITAPAGAVDTTTTVAIDVLSSPLALPMPSGFTGPGTYYVNVEFSPTPNWPLAAPGLTVVLPLRDPMLAGHQISLYRVDPQTGQLVPALDTSGEPVIGRVNADGLSATFTGVARLSTIVGLIPNRRPVAIAIDPYSPGETATIRLKSNRPTDVAILSSASFDARVLVDRSTLTFGRTGEERSLVRCNPGKADVNHDGRPDLVCTFTTALTGFRPGDTAGVLHALTTDGFPIGGTSAIRVVE